MCDKLVVPGMMFSVAVLSKDVVQGRQYRRQCRRHFKQPGTRASSLMSGQISIRFLQSAVRKSNAQAQTLQEQDRCEIGNTLLSGIMARHTSVMYTHL